MTLRTRISVRVVQICNLLLYCRIAFGRTRDCGRQADYKSAIRQNTILRYADAGLEFSGNQVAERFPQGWKPGSTAVRDGRRYILFPLLAILCCSAGAQTADDFFHSGAQSYLTNNVQLALQRVDEGLKRFPDDVKLKKLEELLKKQQQQQQQQNQQDQKDQQQSKSDQNKDQKDQKQDQKNSNQQKQQNDQKQKQDQQSKQDQAKKDQNKKDQQKPDQQQKSADQKKDQKPEDQSQQQAQYVPGQMTPQQAKQLLDAQKGEEMMMPVQIDEKPRQRSGPMKDW